MGNITRQEKEDYLETMYLLKRRQNQVTRSDIEKHLNASPARVNRMVEELIEEGYLYKDEKRRIFLTAIGLNKGREYLEKHRCLTEFLLLITGVDQAVAEQNACWIEHIIDEKIYLGIRMFMESRHVFSYSMRGNDFNFLFPYGEREMPIAIYTKESICPRILAKEYRMFKKKAKVCICEESYLYLEPEEGQDAEMEVYYRYEGEWHQAREQNGTYAILTEAFECNVQRNEWISEGSVPIRIGADESILTVSLI